MCSLHTCHRKIMFLMFLLKKEFEGKKGFVRSACQTEDLLRDLF